MFMFKVDKEKINNRCFISFKDNDVNLLYYQKIIYSFCP